MEVLSFAALLAASVASVMAVDALRMWDTISARPLFIFSAFLMISVVCALTFQDADPASARFILGVFFSSLISCSVAIFLFALIAAHRAGWIRFKNLVVVGLGPLLALYIFAFGSPGWLALQPQRSFGAGTVLNGVGMWSVMLFNDALLYIATLLIILAYHEDVLYRKRLGSLILAFFIPIIASLVGLIGLTVEWYLPLTLFAHAGTGGILFVILFVQGLLKTTPLPRSDIIEKMHMPWMVVDRRDHIRDLNQAAEAAIGRRIQVLGTPVENVLGNWSNIATDTNEARELHIRGEGGGENGKQFFDLTALPILDKDGQGQGRVLVWRDITNQKLQELATQRARDEMFGLLYSISGAASRAQNVNDFLKAAIVQIVNIFEYQYGIVFLASEDYSEGDGQNFLLAAQCGLSADVEKNMTLISGELLLSQMGGESSVLIKDISADERVPRALRNIGPYAMLIVPMLADDDLLGFITLMKIGAQNGLQEDLARLEIIGKQVANFVNGERSRELAISLAERQKLVRDLHDSVTQKLYGLIALTEAAEAGKEAGSLDMLFKVLPKISENARQSLKEMRLFLHQLQPVDLEHEGLQYVLHQRLAAVEGRANINARFISDDDIELGLDKEVALYYIAEEALNNVLKHAGAHAVTVNLRQNRQIVTMEITDDGCGFDPKLVKEGGMGLKNMHYRANSIDGKLKITSEINKGTTISVTVERDKITTQQKR